MKYLVLVQDDDSHWYLIPEENKKDFSESTPDDIYNNYNEHRIDSPSDVKIPIVD